MPCFHPKKGFQIGLTASGAPRYKIEPWTIDYVQNVGKTDSNFPGDWKGFTGDYPNGYFSVYNDYRDGLVDNYIPIPCGNCIGCRLDYARDWSARLMHELEMHNKDECWFLTLTYTDEALFESHYDETIDRLRLGANSLGEAVYWSNLDPRDMQLFWKRLRKQFPDRKIVYYQAGEYGEKRKRCHFHAIVYDLPLDEDDLHFNGVSELGHVTWRSDLLERTWQHGNVIVGKVTTESCAYVARYTLKKAKEMWENDYTNRRKPFVRMSRNPGIGKTYLDAHPEIFDVSRFPVTRQNKPEPFMCPHPRYYMKYLKEVDEDRYNEIKFDRAVAGILAYEKACKNEKPYLDQLRDRELDLIKKTAIMKRKVE